MKLNLVVLYTSRPELLKVQYELLGLRFVYHRHGKGPYHYAAEVDQLVLEIYPLKGSEEKSEVSLRLGFSINNLEEIILLVRDSDWVIVSELKNTPWGKIAVIQDMDGRKVELTST